LAFYFLHLASFAFLELGFAWSNKLLLDFASRLYLVFWMQQAQLEKQEI
jgi:hypothetical protein